MESILGVSTIFKRLLICLAAVLTTLPVMLCHAQNSHITILLSADQSYYQNTAKAITSTLQQHSSDTTFTTTIAYTSKLKTGADQLNNTDMLIAVGTKASRYAIENGANTPLLAILVPRQTYLDMAKNINPEQRKQTSAIYIDQPPSRIISLAQALPLKIKSIGLISGQANVDNLILFKKQAVKKGLQFNHTAVKPDQNPILALRPIFEKSDVFIATPDNAIFNRAMAKWILNLSFQKKVPVIGFSSAYADAGALASIFSSPENIGVQAGELIISYINNTVLPNYQGIYPKYFTIQSNPVIARSFNFDLQSIDQDFLTKKVNGPGND